jgi:predicted O-methyltransferase YrrM
VDNTAQTEFSYCEILQRLCQTKQAVGASGKQFTEIGALSTANNLRAIRNLVLKYQPQNTLEIGLAFGASALAFAAAHRELDRQPNRQHVAVDPVQASCWDDTGRLHLEQAGLEGYVEIREAPSAEVLPAMMAEGLAFEMVYIDGSHLFEDVFVDFYYLRQMLVVGGLLLFDDSTSPHIRKVVRFVERNLQQHFVHVDIAKYRDGPAWKQFARRVAQNFRLVQLTVLRKVGPGVREWNAELERF